MSRVAGTPTGRWAERTFRGAGGAREIRPEDVAEVGRDIRVVDVRERDELLGPLGHVPGSAWLPLEELPALAALGPDAHLVLVSRRADRSTRAARYLEALGMRQVAVMSGGMVAWKAAGYATSRDARVYDRSPLEPLAAPEVDGPLDAARIAAHVGDAAHVRWVRLAALLVHGKRSCVDGRDDSGVIGTPGGDAGELVLALAAAEAVAKVQFSPRAVRELLQRDLDTFGRFYLHTDVHADHALRDAVAADVQLRTHCPDPHDEEAWRSFLAHPPRAARPALLELLVAPAHLGCGHVKRMLTHPETYGARPELTRDVLRAFHVLRWEGAPELEWVTLSGAHDEHGVLNVVMDEPPALFSSVPLVSPRVGSHQLFINHPQVAAWQRSQYAAFLVHARAVDGLGPGHLPALEAELPRLAGAQLTSTLGALAAGLPLFEARFGTGGEVSVRTVG